MIYVIAGLSALFCAIAFLVTEKNAKYLLSGYNSLSASERDQLDLPAYLRFFRRFHLFLGASTLVVGSVLVLIGGANAGGIFLTGYPIAAYIYFIRQGSRYWRGPAGARNRWAVWLLAAALVFTGLLLVRGFRDNRLHISGGQIEIGGSYGESFRLDEIERLGLADALPAIRMKTNGFALGAVRKGWFRTREGEVVKLLVNTAAGPYVLIVKKDGKKIYYSAKSEPGEALYSALVEALGGGGTP